jgi:hypothetical protein
MSLRFDTVHIGARQKEEKGNKMVKRMFAIGLISLGILSTGCENKEMIDLRSRVRELERSSSALTRIVEKQIFTEIIRQELNHTLNDRPTFCFRAQLAYYLEQLTCTMWMDLSAMQEAYMGEFGVHKGKYNSVKVDIYPSGAIHASFTDGDKMFASIQVELTYAQAIIDKCRAFAE